MSIRVNDFKWEPGKNDAEYIKLLESSRDEWQKIAQKAISKLKTLSKTKKTSLEEVAADYGLTVDGVSFALNQYQTIICEITHGMMSKLSYHAKDILQVAQERWCDTCELKEAQEPRVMTIQEIKNADFCYLEVNGHDGVTPVLLKHFIDDKYIHVTINGGSVYFFDITCDVEKLVRCWTSRPTDEQMEATPWE